MERLALIGVSHKRGGARALEAWREVLCREALPELGLKDFVLLETCNRWDVVLTLPEGLTLGELRQRLTPAGATAHPYAYVGDAALEQLARVAASLDSLNPGEDQIMNQVREAFIAAQAAGRAGKELSFAFQAALKAAKRVRREVALAPVNTSLFSLARPAFEAALPHGGTVAILGAGEMGALAAKTLAVLPQVSLVIVNRSLEKAQRLARELGAQAMSLPMFLHRPPLVDAMVCATPARHLIGGNLLAQLPRLKLIVDLGIPRNVAPEVAAQLPVLDVDRLQEAGRARREALAERLAEAERIVLEELELALTEWTERQLGPSIKRLKEWYVATIGDALPPEEAAKLAHKFAHVPVKGLRALAREYGVDAARVFLAETGLSE